MRKLVAIAGFVFVLGACNPVVSIPPGEVFVPIEVPQTESDAVRCATPEGSQFWTGVAEAEKLGEQITCYAHAGQGEGR